VNSSAILFAAFLFLASFTAGTMTTLQIQHYAIYPQVVKESLTAYLRANNKAAFVPAILPAMLLLLASMALLVDRPRFMSGAEAFSVFILNLIALASTFVWQRRLQGEMAEKGYDEQKVSLLISTGTPTTLVENGPFRFTRNPMYVFGSVWYARLALLLFQPWALALLTVVVVTTHYGVVLREEEYLERRFGDAYRRYKARVSRYW